MKHLHFFTLIYLPFAIALTACGPSSFHSVNSAAVATAVNSNNQDGLNTALTDVWPLTISKGVLAGTYDDADELISYAQEIGIQFCISINSVTIMNGLTPCYSFNSSSAQTSVAPTPSSQPAPSPPPPNAAPAGPSQPAPLPPPPSAAPAGPSQPAPLPPGSAPASGTIPKTCPDGTKTVNEGTISDFNGAPVGGDSNDGQTMYFTVKVPAAPADSQIQFGWLSIGGLSDSTNRQVYMSKTSVCDTSTPATSGYEFNGSIYGSINDGQSTITGSGGSQFRVHMETGDTWYIMFKNQMLNGTPTCGRFAPCPIFIKPAFLY